MRLTVSSLASRSELGLTLLCAHDTARLVPVDWAHAIDRVDSDKWIAPGTLVLSSGFQMPDEQDKEGLIAQLNALQKAGACALALDTGGRWPRVPQFLVEHGESINFPVLAVAPDTPFTTVVRAVAEDITAARVNRLSTLVAQQSNFTRTLLRSGLDAVVQQVSKQLDAAVVVVDNFGSVKASSVTGGTLEKTLVAPPYSPQVSKSIVNPRGVRMIQPLTGAVVGQGAIIVDSARFFDESDRLLVSFLSAIVSLSHSRSLSVHKVEEKLRRQALRSLIQGEVPAKENLALFDLTEGSQVTGMCITGASVDMSRLNSELLGFGVHFLATQESGLEDRDGSVQRRSEGNTAASSTPNGKRYLVVHDGTRDIARALLTRLRPTYPQLRIGVGERVELRNAALSIKQAQAAVPQETSRVRVRSITELPTHEVILSVLADGNAFDVLAGGAYRKLKEYDASNYAGVVQAAEAYINTNGRFESMAKALGVHRQTARARAQLIEEILDCSLEDPDVRAELWLAFRTAHRRS